MRVVLTHSLAELHPRVEGFLAERVERNVQASLLVHARAGRIGGKEPLFAWSADEHEELLFFAMRIPPWPLLVSDLVDRRIGEAKSELLPSLSNQQLRLIS